MKDATDGVNHTESENDSLGTTKPTRRKKGKGRSRYPHFGEFSVIFVDILLILLILLMTYFTYLPY